MSLYAHNHFTQSRRDDMEAIGTVLLLYLHGKLKWDKYRGQSDYKERVFKEKQNLANVIFFEFN